jgi:hypothetical protein
MKTKNYFFAEKGLGVGYELNKCPLLHGPLQNENMKNFFKINTKMLMRYLHVQNVDAVLGA